MAVKTTREAYDKLPGQRYSELSRFWISPAHALMEQERKGFFVDGNAFEMILQDYCEGSNEFEKHFAVAEDLDGDIPDGLVAAVEDGHSPERILNDLIKFNKDGKTRSGIHKRAHAWVDFAVDNPGRMPIGGKSANILGRMMTNMLKLEIYDIQLKDLLKDAIWQQAISWESQGIKKKMLLDCAVVVDVGEEKTIIFDVKTAASLHNFEKFLKSKYWIQNFHYIEGAGTRCETLHPSLVFIVVEKTPPYLARRYEIAPQVVADGQDVYRRLSREYDEWERAGKPTVSCLPPKFIKPYFEK